MGLLVPGRVVCQEKGVSIWHYVVGDRLSRRCSASPLTVAPERPRLPQHTAIVGRLSARDNSAAILPH